MGRRIESRKRNGHLRWLETDRVVETKLDLEITENDFTDVVQGLKKERESDHKG